MELLLIALAICLFLLLLSAVVFVALVMQLRKYPPEVPRSDLPLFRVAFRAAYRELGLTAWGDFPAGIHRHDAHLYAAFFVIFRDTYLGDGAALTRAEREIIATAISVSNRCHFCINIHSTLVRTSSEPGVAGLILDRRPEKIADPRERDLARFGLSTKEPAAAIIRNPPFTADEVSDAAVLALGFHYLNRVLDSVGMRQGIKTVALSSPPRFALVRIMGLEQNLEAGIALRQVLASGLTHPIMMSDADRANILRITRNRAEVANSILFTWSTIQHTARALFDEEVLTTIRVHLAGWQGENAPLGSDWLESAVQPLSFNPMNQALARQGVLIAREPFRTSRRELWEVCGHSNRRQLALACFAAFAAALRIVEWIPIPNRS
ncbi:MAG TPA: hypothetical protein ENK18_07455 [Deltaproteobacteria bacterium]|nr:hypothetical protein [Deltaproteobacteria bacterium]